MSIHEDKIEMEDRTELIHHYDADSKVYLSTKKEFLAGGIGLPANSTLVPYEPKEGFIGYFGTKARGQWEYVEDLSLKEIRRTDTGELVNIPRGALKELVEGITDIPITEAKAKLLSSGKYFLELLEGKWVTRKVLLGQTIYSVVGGYPEVVDDKYYQLDDNYTLIKPDSKLVNLQDEDTHLLFDLEKQVWVLLENWNGKLLYNKNTCEEVKLNQWLVNLPEDVTDKPYPGGDSKWDVKADDWTKPTVSAVDKAIAILHLSDACFLVPDYQVNGATITEEMRTELLEYRAKLRQLIEKDGKRLPSKPKWLEV